MNINKRFTLAIILIISFTSGTLAHAMYSKTSQAFTPALKSRQDLIVGMASWYSKQSPGIKRTTANMEIFDDTAMTCAMWGVPFNQQIKITNLSNGKSVIVRVNDRGPNKRLVKKGRLIDLSRSAFQKIAPLKEGLVPVKIELL
ncbi:MAG: septal ring lytic transglycosylase RlpA family protein [Candidatus Omnitrophota bacterium]